MIIFVVYLVYLFILILHMSWKKGIWCNGWKSKCRLFL